MYVLLELDLEGVYELFVLDLDGVKVVFLVFDEDLLLLKELFLEEALEV